MFNNIKSIRDNFMIDENLGKARDFINLKIFTSKDTSLTYRTLNILGEASLLEDEKENKMDWRKFSFKELVYVSIINELRMLHIGYEDLYKIKDSFFDLEAGKEFVIENKMPTIGDILILYILKGVEISLIYFNSQEIFYVDPFTELFLPKEFQSYIHLSINPIVNRYWSKLGYGDLPVIFSNDANHMKLVENYRSEEERKVINLLRDKTNTSVEIRKSDNKINLAYAEKNNTPLSGETPVSTILRLLKANDFENINITKRNGKIVNIKTEEITKF